MWNDLSETAVIEKAMESGTEGTEEASGLRGVLLAKQPNSRQKKSRRSLARKNRRLDPINPNEGALACSGV
jgi:hypothetical protein